MSFLPPPREARCWALSARAGRWFFALASDALNELVRLEDASVRKAVKHRAALAPGRYEPRRPQHRKMLAHVGNLAAHPHRQLPYRQLAGGERFEDAEAFWVRQRPTDGCVPLPIGFGRCHAFQHLDSLSLIPQ